MVPALSDALTPVTVEDDVYESVIVAVCALCPETVAADVLDVDAVPDLASTAEPVAVVADVLLVEAVPVSAFCPVAVVAEVYDSVMVLEC